MAIEVGGKKEIKIPTWSLVIMGISLVSFLVLLSSYIYFFVSIKRVEAEIEKIDIEITSQKERIKPVEKKAFEYEVRIRDLGKILRGHKKISSAFNVVEELTHPRVWFSSFSYSSESREISLNGTAENFVALGQQIIILQDKLKEENPKIEELNLSGITMGEDGITFSLSLTISPWIIE